MNRIILCGHLTTDPVINATNSGKSVTKFGLAVKREFTKNDETDFFNITAWGATAEFCCKYFEKGRKMLLSGRVQTGKYTDKNGVEKPSFDVIVDSVEFADSKKKDSTNDDDIDVPF